MKNVSQHCAICNLFQPAFGLVLFILIDSLLELVFLTLFSDPLHSEFRNMKYKVVQKKSCTTLQTQLWL
ncbi:Uncharacterised protein [Vibrio cholerae]|nr:Uncharacterised protein [Vibrio cholerae]